MDTIENSNEPVGGEDVSSSQDTSANDTQPVETETVVDGNQSEEAGEASELLAGKYKNSQELEKGYKELESKLGEVGQKASLINKLEETTGMTAQQIANYLTQQEQAQQEQAIRDNPGLAAFQEVQSLKNQLALQAEEKELDKFLGSEEGKSYAQHRDKIFKLGLQLEKDKSYAEIAKEYFGEARAIGQQDAYKKIDMKQSTQATGASQSAPAGKLTPEDMDKMTASELEKVLPWADISNRPY